MVGFQLRLLLLAHWGLKLNRSQHFLQTVIKDIGKDCGRSRVESLSRTFIAGVLPKLKFSQLNLEAFNLLLQVAVLHVLSFVQQLLRPRLSFYWGPFCQGFASRGNLLVDVLQFSIFFSQFPLELTFHSILLFLHLPSLVLIAPLDLPDVTSDVANVLVQLLQLPLNLPLSALTLVDLAPGLLDLLADGRDPLTGQRLLELLAVRLKLVSELLLDLFLLSLDQVVFLVILVLALALQVVVLVHQLVRQLVHFPVVLRLQSGSEVLLQAVDLCIVLLAQVLEALSGLLLELSLLALELVVEVAPDLGLLVHFVAKGWLSTQTLL